MNKELFYKLCDTYGFKIRTDDSGIYMMAYQGECYYTHYFLVYFISDGRLLMPSYFEPQNGNLINIGLIDYEKTKFKLFYENYKKTLTEIKFINKINDLQKDFK